MDDANGHGLKQRIEAFRGSVSSTLLSQRDFIDWDVIEQPLASAASSIGRLQALVDGPPINELSLAQLIHQDAATYPLLLDLIAFNTTGAQVEKWGLPQSINSNFGRTRWVAEQLLHIGVSRLLTNAVSIEAQLRLAEVHKDSYRRRFRARTNLPPLLGPADRT